MRFLGIAYLIVWILISAYLFTLVRRHLRLEERVARLAASAGVRDNPES